MQEQKLVPVTDPDFELLAVNKAEGFRAGAQFYTLPPLELGQDTGFVQPIEPHPLRRLTIELEINRNYGDEERAADAAGKAALRQQVARELYAQRCAQAKALARRELIFQLGGCVKGTLPKDLVSGNYFAEQRNFNLRLQANNVNFDQYLKVRGQTVEQFRTELHAQAEQKLRGSLGLLMVAEREHLWPTDAEVEAALAHWKGERTFPANDFRKVRQGIASQRAAEFVEAHSTLLPPAGGTGAGNHRIKNGRCRVPTSPILVFLQGLHALELAVIELGIEAALRQQGVVVALLHDVAILITRMTSASRMVDRRWATIKLVRPCIIRAKAAWMRTSVRVSMEEVASSKSQHGGSGRASRGRCRAAASDPD